MSSWILGDWFRVRPWPKWVKVQLEMLAKYVTPKARQGIDLGIPVLGPDVRNRQLQIAEKIYEKLREVGITYRHAPFQTMTGEQVIRSPQEVLQHEKEGTCIDLALTFAGICLHCDVLPIIAVFGGDGKDSHVIACIVNGVTVKEYKKHNRKDRILWSNGIYSGPIWKEDGSTSPEVLGHHFPDWIVPIECTGFASAPYLAQAEGDKPENKGRDATGKFQWQQTFKRALEAGMEQFRLNDRKFLFAIDIVTEHQDRGQTPYELPFFWGLAGFRKFACLVFAVATAIVMVMLGWFSHQSNFELAKQLYIELQQAPITDLKGRLDSETVTSGIKKALVPLATADVSLSNWEGLSDVDFENISRQSARAATILALNGDLRQVERILRSPECQQSPDVRTFLSFFVTASNVSVDLIVNRIQAIKAEKSVEASAEAYGLLLILGRYQDSAWDEERSIKIIELLRKLYADHPDPGVHACAFWVLRWMKDPAAREALKVETEKLVAVGIERLLSQDLNRRNWFVDQKTRLTFIYMPPAEKVRLGDPRLEGVSADLYKVTRATTAFPRTVSIEHPFAIAMQEYPDMEAGNNAGPDFPEVCQPPKSELTWNTAAAMCDRLNETFKTPIKMYSEATNPLRLSAEAQDKKLGGYRLPTEDEWEYAARGGSTTDTPYGNRIAEFSGKLFTFLERPFPRGWHPPNQYGLFDAAGSMREWCEQVSVSLDDLSKRSSQRIVRGGGFESTGLSDLASWRRIMLPHQGGGNIGLRLTFTISKSRISDRARF